MNQFANWTQFTSNEIQQLTRSTNLNFEEEDNKSISGFPDVRFTSYYDIGWTGFSEVVKRHKNVNWYTYISHTCILIEDSIWLWEMWTSLKCNCHNVTHLILLLELETLCPFTIVGIPKSNRLQETRRGDNIQMHMLQTCCQIWKVYINI